MNKRILILFFLLQTVLCRAQQYRMLHYTREDGLPSNNVYRIFQDKEGMLWFATDKGVSRYNGLKFENFTKEDGLPDNDIFYFVQDYEGRIWMATYNGTIVYYKDGIFHSEKNTPFLRNTRKNVPTVSMELQRDSSLIIGFENTQFLIIKQEQIQSILIRSNYISLSKLRKWGTDKFQAYLGDAHYIYRCILDSSGRILSDSLTDFYDFIRWEGNCFIKKSGKKLYTQSNTYIRDLPDSFGHENIINAVYERSGHCFTSTNYGLWVDNNLILKQHRVASVFQDRQGNYWIATLNNGVYKLPEHFTGTFFRDQVYSNTISNSLQQQDIIFGTTEMNLYRLSDTGIHLFFDYSKAYKKQRKNPHYFLLPQHKDYYVLTGTENLRVRTDDNAATPLPQLKTSYNPLVLKNLLLLNDSQICYQTADRIHLLGTDALFKDIDDKIIYGIDQGKRFYHLQVSPDKQLWLNQNGVFKVEGRQAIRQTQFGNLVFQRMIFCRNFLAGIDLSNRLIIARNYNSKDAVIDSSLKNGCIWDRFYPLTDSSVLVSTNNYYRVITFGCKDCPKGYRIDVLEYPFIPQLAELIHSDKKKCYFFKNGTVTGINIGDMISSPALPELCFKWIQAGNKKIPTDRLVQLDYNDSRNLSVYYNTLSYNTTDISFEYSITKEGQADNWTKSNGTNIDLFNIAAGDYTIRIRAFTFGGRYSAVKTLQLHVNAPFWLSWWFIILIIGFTGLIVFLVVRAFARRRLEKKEKENKFLRSEFTALNALMNPHFVFNSLNSVQSLINKEDLEAANQYVRTISDLLRQNMHNISRELIPLKREMELIDNYMKLEKLRFKERLQYTITMAEDVEEDFVLVPPLLVQPLVENAIKYTLAFSEISTGRISIDIYTREEKVYIDVTDNGRGLNASKAQKNPGHESTALGNIKSRLEQLSQIHGKQYQLEIEELKNDTGDISGTRARISIEL